MLYLPLLVTALSVHFSECAWRQSEFMVTVNVSLLIVGSVNKTLTVSHKFFPPTHAKISQSSCLRNMAEQLI